MVGLGNLLEVRIEGAVSDCTKSYSGLGLFFEGLEREKLAELVA